MSVLLSVLPGDVRDCGYDRIAERVASNLQHAPCDQQEEEEGATHNHDHVHPHALPVESTINRESV